MQVASSAERVVDVPGRVRAAMVLIGLVPFVHACTAVATVVWAYASGRRWLYVLPPIVLFLVPPLLVRIATFRRPLGEGEIPLASPAFLQWWFTAQCQILFARLPWLEEVMRLVPSLYSAWLRLWGARIGSLVYWSPGVVVLDRSLLQVGDRVVFGAGVRIVPHALAPARDGGGGALFLGRVTVDNDALIGGYSSLLPGCVVDAGAVTPPFRSVHAFTRVEHGRRVRMTHAERAVDADALVD